MRSGPLRGLRTPGRWMTSKRGDGAIGRRALLEGARRAIPERIRQAVGRLCAAHPVSRAALY